MKITGLNVYPVKGRHWPRFPIIFLEIMTDEGFSGLGESLAYKTSGVIQSIQALGETLVGCDPFTVEAIWERMYRQGGNMAAISGIETALWDIIGKALGTPTYNLLGGKCRDRIRVYADGFFRGAEYVQEEYAEKAVAALEEGFTALKMDVDEPIPSGKGLNRSLSTEDLVLTVQMVGAVRKAVGEEIDLCIDAHGAFDVVSATKLGRKLEDYNLMWIEDPVPMGNMLALSKVSREIETPICTGELMETRFEFRELFERQAADIIMPDLARTGGLLEMKKIAAMADTYYIPVSPHNMAGPLATIASAHLCACIPNFMVLEYQLSDVPWRDDLLTTPVPIKGGYLELSEEPGLGVDLNRKAVEKYRAE